MEIYKNMNTLLRINGLDYLSNKEVQRDSAENNKEEFQCGDCTVVFPNQNDLKLHKCLRHECKECNTKYSTLNELNRHKASNHSQPIKCNLCEYQSTNLDIMIDHRANVHTHICENCNFKASTIGEIKLMRNPFMYPQ